MNKTIGDLSGYHCRNCLNKGYVALITETGRMATKRCYCIDIRKSIKLIEKSGLKDLLKELTFEKYKAEQPWQKYAKNTAQNFLKDYEGKWFFMGGQVGCGKTHICTAIVSEFLKQEKPSRYMLWRDETVRLKAVITDDVAYSNNMRELKEAEILYIDDFFKTERGKKPSTADINIAFELLNYRYCNKNLVTIISTELSVDDIIDIDEAVGSRIYQRTKEYCLICKQDRSKNYRLRET